jgi:formylglycine-generating enzyme required for sulfatase activity
LSLAVVAVVGGVMLLRYRQAREESVQTSTSPRGQKLNDTAAPGAAPEGMAWIPGGWFWMGANEFPDAMPEHLVYVDGFWMDKHEVTNAEFARFVEATDYKTIAERPLDPKEFPTVPPEDLKPGSIVFKPPAGAVSLDNHLQWWTYVPGANWRHPEGPESTIEGRENHPAVHIAWHDAVAYAQWADKRLPSEAEWELAARGGLDRAHYCWGNELREGDRWRSNIWQGNFPNENTAGDGFRTTAPVGSFGAGGYGLSDMSGNVWEWCSDWYRPDYYQVSEKKNPPGPGSSFDPLEPGMPKRVQRGGSYMCSDLYCTRYVPGARGKGEPSSAAGHIGFRCAKSAK